MDFVKMVGEEIEACETIGDMFSITPIIHGMASFAGVKEYGIPAWRDKARRMIPNWEQLTVVAVDLNQVFHCAYAVDPSGASDLCLKMLRNVYKDTSPSQFVIATDCRKGVAKKYTSLPYKVNRTPKPADFYKQLGDTIDTLATKVCVEEHDGMEADDCLATIAFQCALLGCKCVLVSTDSDLWQALYSGVAMYDRKTKEYRNATWLKAHHRITHKQVVDWHCLVGGKNDLPGVPGVGAKTASEWLEAYGDFIGAMDATKNEEMKQYFLRHYWAVKEAHTLNVSVGVRWFSRLNANK
jgi:5'-3' exonuclease